jgi:hypothetical protein
VYGKLFVFRFFAIFFGSIYVLEWVATSPQSR